MTSRGPWAGAVLFSAVVLLGAHGCARCTATVFNPNDAGSDAGTTPDSGTTMDAGQPPDSGTSPDSGQGMDSGTPDAGPKPDGGGMDSGTPDSGMTTDSGTMDSGTPDAGTDAGLFDVVMHRNDYFRDGVYVDPNMTKAAVANMHVDPAFNVTTMSQTFAQPLFMENGPTGVDSLFVVTETNDVYALDAATGTQLWHANVGASVPSQGTSCKGSGFCGGSIYPFGISGTPALDTASRTLYFNAMLLSGASGQPTHTIFAMNIDTQVVNWKVDLDTQVTGFDSCIQNERSAVLLFGGRVYVVYGGLDGDCGSYKGWVVGVNTSNPTDIVSWKTAAPSGSGIWGTSGATTDGTSIIVATTNTNGGPSTWSQANSEAIIRLTPGLTFSGNTADYFAMSKDSRNGNQDWFYNDVHDLDLGSSGVVLFDAPGATPSQLAFASGKTQYGYLVDRNNLGGISPGISATIPHTAGQVFGSLLAYNTNKPATYVSGGAHFHVTGAGFCQTGNTDFTVLQVTHTAPPSLAFAWCGKSGGDSAPIVSTTDSTGNQAILWTYGANGDEIVRAYDADNGMLLYTSPSLPGATHWISPIIAKGRYYVAGNGRVTALTVK